MRPVTNDEMSRAIRGLIDEATPYKSLDVPLLGRTSRTLPMLRKVTLWMPWAFLALVYTVAAVGVQ